MDITVSQILGNSILAQQLVYDNKQYKEITPKKLLQINSGIPSASSSNGISVS